MKLIWKEDLGLFVAIYAICNFTLFEFFKSYMGGMYNFEIDLSQGLFLCPQSFYHTTTDCQNAGVTEISSFSKSFFLQKFCLQLFDKLKVS